MTRLILALLAASTLAEAHPRAPQAPPTLRRFALVAGANRGSADQPPLRYAVSDAERFARVLTGMGGVAPADATLLREPRPQVFLDALSALGVQAAEARRQAGRVEVLVYFSGHADDQGLLLGAERLSYRDLRAAIRALPVEVGIAVLDACASGAITRLKGGELQPAFLSDVSMDVQGYAFLASSSESETAQESDRLGGSYFTHALLTGLRGAADVSGDGRVTLGEAYQFAFNETLTQTTTSQGGAQHPSYDIKMAGTGDVVMTDVRKISASLIFGAEYDGRFYVLDSSGRLVAEMEKPEGRTLELGLEPGEYRVYYKQSEKLLSSPLKLEVGQRQEVVRGGLRPAPRLPTLSRGGSPVPERLDGRTRVEVLLGVPGAGSAGRDGRVIYGGANSVSVLHWLRPGLALEGGLLQRDVTDETPMTENPFASTFEGVIRGGVVGARYYPGLRGPLRPYVSASVGAFDVPYEGGLRLGTVTGLGGDLLLGRRLSLSLQGTFSRVSGQATHFETRLGMGFSWGGRGGPADAPPEVAAR